MARINAATSTVNVTTSEMLDILLNRTQKGAKILYWTRWTDFTLLKKGRNSGNPCPWPSGVTHIVREGFCLGGNYQNAVNRQRVKEQGEAAEEFAALPSWMEKYTAYTGYHRTKGYLYFYGLPQQVEVEGTEAGRMHVTAGDCWINNATEQPIECDDTLREFLPKAGSGSKRQDVDHKVLYRTYHVESIRQIAYGGVLYNIQPEALKVPESDRTATVA
jgi:hypothetical protein